MTREPPELGYRNLSIVVCLILTSNTSAAKKKSNFLVTYILGKCVSMP